MRNGKVEEAKSERPKIVRCDGPALNKHWPWLRARLLVVKQKAQVASKRNGLSRSYAEWQPEHLRMAILKGLAGQNTVELYLVLGLDDAIEGFFLVTYPFDEFLQIPLTMHVWIAESEKVELKAGLLDQCEPFVDALAIERGCIQIEVHSLRMGWMRRLRTLGKAHGG